MKSAGFGTLLVILIIIIGGIGCTQPAGSQENENIPDGWPSDIPFIEDFEVSINHIDDQVIDIVLTGDLSPDEVRDYYVSKMEELGWKRSSVGDGPFEEELNGIKVLHYENDDWILGINIATNEESGKTELKFRGLGHIHETTGE